MLTFHRWASYSDLELSAHESQPAVAIGTYYVGMLNNLSLFLFLYLIKLSLSNLKNKKGPMTRDSYLKNTTYHSVSEKKMAQTKATLYD